MSQNVRASGTEVLKYWTDQYFLKDLTPFQKRLFNWWVNEGFFCVSNFQDTEDGTKADLMLLVGDSTCQVLGYSDNLPAEKESAIEMRQKEGWELLKSSCEGYCHVEDTVGNHRRIERLIDENIRNYRILEYADRERADGRKYLKSVTVEIYKKR